MDACYLGGVYHKLNELNQWLQGKKVTLIDRKKAITSFIEKLELSCQNLLRKGFYQFSELCSLKILVKQLVTFANHLAALKGDMGVHFCNMIYMKVEP